MGKSPIRVASPVGSLERLHVREDGEEVRKYLCREHRAPGNHQAWDGTKSASGPTVLDRCSKVKVP